jgi:hypothetical protein
MAVDPDTANRVGAFHDLRGDALQIPREKWGVPTAATATTPWGVIMETNLGDVSYTLLALATGQASVYRSSGGGTIGGGDHALVRQAAQAMVTLAADFQPRASLATDFSLPQSGETAFYLRTDAGVFTLRARQEDLGKDRHPWSPLFYAGYEVMGQIQIIEDQLFPVHKPET